jgi:hypothetical protein
MLAQSKPSLVLNTPTHTVSSSQDAIEEITEVHLVLRHFEQTICLLKAKSDRLQSREDRPNRPKGQCWPHHPCLPLYCELRLVASLKVYVYSLLTDSHSRIGTDNSCDNGPPRDHIVVP